MTDLTTRRGTEPRDLHPVDPPSVFPHGVELTRLIARAQLTLAQAVELAAAVAAEAARRSPPDGDTAGREPVLSGPVLVGADGRVVPGPAANGRAPASARPVGALLHGIADAARPRARAAGPAAEQMLAEVDRALAQLPDAGVLAVARMLRDATGAIDRVTVRAEIGALVRAIGAGPAQAPSSRPAGVPAAPVRPSPGRARPVRRRAVAWLLSVLVLAGVVLLEAGFLRDHIAGDIRLLLDAGRGGSTHAVARTSAEPAVPAPAPASAGAVTGVDLRALSPCAPGAACSVRLLVRLAPGAGQQVVTWDYRIVDLCTGATATAPGGSMAVPPGGQRAAAVTTVALPAGPGLALVALTREPAVAASAPVLVGSCPPRP